MQVEISVFKPEKILKLVFTGVFDINKYEHIYQQIINHPEFITCMNLIWDTRQMEIHDISPELLQKIGQIGEKYGKKRGAGRTAFVVGTDLHFGSARMFNSLYQDRLPFSLMIFRDINTAEEWITADFHDQT